MKSKYIIFFILVYSINTLAQTIRTETYIEGSPVSYGLKVGQENQIKQDFSILENLDFEQKVYWRKSYNNDGLEKDAYWFNSAYVKDKMVGIKLIGIDFNFLHEKFNKVSWNAFRNKNCIRAGGALSLEHNPNYDFYPINKSYKYINIDIYLKILHRSKLSRGDKHTRYRKGTWALQFYRDVRKRKSIIFKIKPLNFIWLSLRYKKSLYRQESYAFLIEFELNPDGYNNCKVESTKDVYKGLLIFAGPEYNSTLQLYSLKFGMFFSYRNH